MCDLNEKARDRLRRSGPEAGYTVFLEYFDASGFVRMVIPPKVADAIDRQRQALSDRIRRESARRVAQERKARGELPGFMKKRSAAQTARLRVQSRKSAEEAKTARKATGQE